MSASSPAASARSVTSVVRAARAGLLAARTLECLLLCAAGALLASSAALASGAEGAAWSVAALCGILAAATWWCEHARPLSATVRALDAALRQEGALALAFELEGRRPAAASSRRSAGLSEMEELVRARVLSRLRAGTAVRAVLPSPFVPLSAAAVAALCLLLALEHREAIAPATDDVAALATGLEAALGAALEAEGTAGASTEARELREEAAALRAALHGLPEAAGESHEAGARARLEDLDRRVAEHAGRAPPASTSATRLAEARAWIDALRAALEAGAGEGAAGTGAGNLTGGAPDGTISRPMADPAAPAALLPPAPPLASLGLQAGSFWPAEYDAVVERWIELSRAARVPDDGR